MIILNGYYKILKWYIELPLFLITFLIGSYFMGNLLNMNFNIITEIFTGIVAWILIRFTFNKKRKDRS